MRIFLERNYSALKSIFLDGNSQNDKHNRGSLTLSPMGSNPTDFLWGGHMAPPMYLENQRSSGLDFWQVSCPDYLLSKNTPPTPGQVINLLTSAYFEVCQQKRAKSLFVKK